PTLMKIDVEGSEVPVFSGMSRFLNQVRPSIVLECFHRDNCKAITEVLRPLGYNFFTIDEHAGTLRQTSQLEPADLASGSFNQLLTTRSASELKALMPVIS